MAFSFAWPFGKSGNPPEAAASRPNLGTSILARQDYPAGERVTPDTALTIGEILCCVRVLAEEIAALPLDLMVSADGETKKATGTTLYDLMRHAPNAEMTAYEFRMWVVVDSLLRGTGYAQVRRNGRGKVVELWPLLAREVSAIRDEDGNLWFKVGQNDYLPDSDVLRIQILPYGGIIGQSLIDLQSGTLGGYKAANDTAAEFLKNDGQIGKYVKLPGELSAEAFERMRDGIRQWTNGGMRGGTPLLEGGAEIVPLTLNAQEAQLLDARKFNRSQVAGLFRVPPHMIGDLDKATFSNIEHQDIAFVRHSLRPLLTAWEQRLDKTLLTQAERVSGYYFNFNLRDLLRGDTKTQAETASILINCGAMTINEARAAFDMGKVESGDLNFVQGALRPITQPYQSSAGTTGQP